MRVVRLCILFVAMIADGGNSVDVREGGKYGELCCGGVQCYVRLEKAAAAGEIENRGCQGSSSMDTRWRK
jgi:hypothetical protein